jgi:hypothetical protein
MYEHIDDTYRVSSFEIELAAREAERVRAARERVERYDRRHDASHVGVIERMRRALAHHRDVVALHKSSRAVGLQPDAAAWGPRWREM